MDLRNLDLIFFSWQVVHSRVKWVNFLHEYYVAIVITTSSKSDQWPKQAPHPMNMLIIRVNLIDHYVAIFITNKVTKWPWEQAPIGADSVEYACNNTGQVGYVISLSYCYH
jgi:hypothetical protein